MTFRGFKVERKRYIYAHRHFLYPARPPFIPVLYTTVIVNPKVTQLLGSDNCVLSVDSASQLSPSPPTILLLLYHAITPLPITQFKSSTIIHYLCIYSPHVPPPACPPAIISPPLYP